jgi:hypothetical protein
VVGGGVVGALPRLRETGGWGQRGQFADEGGRGEVEVEGKPEEEGRRRPDNGAIMVYYNDLK